MKKTTTYAVIDTVTGVVIGTGLDAEEARECIFLNKLGCSNERYATFEETEDLVRYLYDLAATIYEDGAEADSMGDDQGAAQCADESSKMLSIAGELEEIYADDAEKAEKMAEFGIYRDDLPY